MASNLITATASTNELRAIKPPIDIPSGWAWLWWTLGALAIAAAAAFVVRYWLRRRALIPPVPVIPPHERARRKLEAALDYFDRPKTFCILVSDAVRLYLEERFSLHAPERTTEEFLSELTGSAALTAAQKSSLYEFLVACDLVKFARHEPGRAELEELYNAALRLIEETEPTPAPTAIAEDHAPRATHHETAERP